MLTIYPIPALDSNYFWLLQPDAEKPDAYVVDPGDAPPVLEALDRHQLQLSGILITHHHWDHTDGIDELLARFPVPVYGPHSERIPRVTHPLREGEQLGLPGLVFDIIALPGHTLDHIAYFQQPEDAPPRLFCGDTLFAAGCGRLFEGSPAQMHDSLSRLAALPGQTRVYCTHEYTLSNLRFAQAVEPDNPQIAQRLKEVSAWRAEGRISLPSNLALECATNPFLRTTVEAVKAKIDEHDGLQQRSPSEVFARLRAWKDNF